MSLDGLRAWIGEVERKLGVRTRVFLVLTAIALGGAGAGIYLALDASEEATGEADVSALEGRVDQLESQATGEPDLAPLELQVQELREQVERLEGKGTAGAAAGGASAEAKDAGAAAASGAVDNGGGVGAAGATGDTGAAKPPATPSEKALPDAQVP